MQALEQSSPAVPGSEPMSADEFQKWVRMAEAAPTISLEEAKVAWEQKRKLMISISENC